ncbi:MAG TPA: DUF5666 domain-containing protein [Jatrophihabitantaceae bacterium]|nr:DUF5666 domain-containing protein [Jatrophihabitantaceae bacterium]
MTNLDRRVVLLGAAALGAALALSACGSSGANPPASSAAGGPVDQGTPSGAPAASGKVAAISATTMQVQNEQTGQVAVSWSASTKFRHQVAVTVADVKAGDCVAAVAPSGTDSSATSFTATTVTISPAVNGSCTGGAAGPGGSGGPGGGRFTGAPPSGFPSGKLPSGLPSGVQGRPVAAVAAGKVMSVSGSTLVIAARQFGSSSTSTTNRTVTVDGKTKITTEASTTSKSLKVGKCVAAQGKADSAGTVAATSVRISDPVNGQCGIFFGGFGGKGNG